MFGRILAHSHSHGGGGGHRGGRTRTSGTLLVLTQIENGYREYLLALVADVLAGVTYGTVDASVLEEGLQRCALHRRNEIHLACWLGECVCKLVHETTIGRLGVRR